MWVFGGWNGSHTFNNVDVINVSSLRIRAAEPLLVPLSFPGRPSVIRQELNDTDLIVIASGSNGTHPFTATIFYDSGSSAPMQVNLQEGVLGAAVTTVLADGILYTVMAGGFSQERGYLDDLKVFNHSSETWTTVSMKLSTPRAYASATSVGHHLIVIGGYNGIQSRDEVDVFDFLAMNITNVNISLRYARHDHSSAVLGRYVYIGGGRNADNHTYASVEILDSRNWTLIDANVSLSSTGKYFQGSTSTNFGVFFVGGMSSMTNYSAVIDIFVCGNDVHFTLSFSTDSFHSAINRRS